MTNRSAGLLPVLRIFRYLPYSALLALVVAPGAAFAQGREGDPITTAARGGKPASCSVVADKADVEGVQTIQAICGERLLILGKANAYRVVPNERLNATLIDLQFAHERRVLLLSVGADGLPLLEDISGQIALAAGRGPMSDIADVTVEPGEFANSGRIAVQADARAQAAPGEVRRIALDEQLARERSR